MQTGHAEEGILPLKIGWHHEHPLVPTDVGISCFQGEVPYGLFAYSGGGAGALPV
jgi:hypothetical protein